VWIEAAKLAHADRHQYTEIRARRVQRWAPVKEYAKERAS